MSNQPYWGYGPPQAVYNPPIYPPPYGFPPSKAAPDKTKVYKQIKKFLKEMEKEDKEEQDKKKKDIKKPVFNTLQWVIILTLFGPPVGILYFTSLTFLFRFAATMVQ